MFWVFHWVSLQFGLVLFQEIVGNFFFNIIKDGSDGNIQIKTILLVNPNYLLRIKNAKNEYWKVLLVGDACFRKF